MFTAEAFLLSLPRFADAGASAMKPGLERIRALLAGMGHPEEAFKCVLVGGTNGKGSVASMIAAIATSGGLRTGLHTSPHLLTVNERMRVDGGPAAAEWLDGAASRFRPLFERIGGSFFEVTLALSLLHFAEEEVDVGIVEVGLGGRLDASNALDPRLSIVTRVALDHQELLGDTLSAIAREKADIARSGRKLLTAVDDADAFAALCDVATNKAAEVEHVSRTTSITIREHGESGLVVDLRTPQALYQRLRVGVPGEHQAQNAALAVRAAEEALELPEEGRPDAVRQGLGEVVRLSGLRGRCEILTRRPLIMADVAHNADAMRVALKTFSSAVSGEKTVLLGLMRDKDAASIAETLRPHDLDVVTTGVGGGRALDAHELVERLGSAGVNARPVEGVHTAVRHFLHGATAPDGLLATGSHLVVAEALRAVEDASR